MNKVMKIIFDMQIPITCALLLISLLKKDYNEALAWVCCLMAEIHSYLRAKGIIK